MNKNTIAIIGTIWPEPTSTAAGSRMLQLIEVYQDLDFEVHFLCASTKNTSSINLDILNVNCHAILLNDSSFNNCIASIDPNFVMYDRFVMEEQYSWRVREVLPDCIHILDTEDLHFLRSSREKAFKKTGTLDIIDWDTPLFKRELASIMRSDLTLLISDFEEKLLISKFSISKNILITIPFLCNESHLPTPSTIEDFMIRKHFVSIGNFLHEPNWQTVLRLSKWWPLIQKKDPELQLHIYGAYTPDKALQLHNPKKGFYIMGKAESVEKLYTSARVLLAPIPYGAGQKGKLFESMLYGLPNITTWIGAEGMTGGDRLWNGFIVESEDDFADKALQLYHNYEQWRQAQINGYSLIQNRYLKSIYVSNIREKLHYILNNTNEHRVKNPTILVLNQQQFQSTKYMSKWIEEKNKYKNGN